jgi:uncharacterized protein YqjF (DUF2071 family)
MANFHIESKILKPYVPAFTELDEWNGNHYVSLVGFLFRNTQVFGMRFPFHTNFEEVNLRFYVRFKDGGQWKRGVVFIKELVPRSAITFIANALYHEHYATHKMSHQFKTDGDAHYVSYNWKVQQEENYLKATTGLARQPVQSGSEEEFITEHYWGYTKVNAFKTTSYEVQHPRWNIFPVRAFDFKCNVEKLYGTAFKESLSSQPTSVFLADGSPINVMNKQIIVV